MKKLFFAVALTALIVVMVNIFVACDWFEGGETPDHTCQAYFELAYDSSKPDCTYAVTLWAVPCMDDITKYRFRWDDFGYRDFHVTNGIASFNHSFEFPGSFIIKVEAMDLSGDVVATCSEPLYIQCRDY